MIVEVSKIGSGTMDDPYIADTEAAVWSVVSETEETYTIDIKET